MMSRFGLTLSLLCLLPLMGTACSGDSGKETGSADEGDDGTTGDGDDTDGDDTDGDDTGGDTDAPDAVCTESEPATCEDAIILDLALHDDKVSEGAVGNTTDGDDFVTTVDATAGGYSNYMNNPWVYVKFTESGAERVDIDDVTALESMDWDISLRRYLIRLNGGTSGGSCVGAVTLPETAYGDVTALPEDTPFVEDEFYTEDCTFINDSSGLPGSPQVALGQWWEYPGCVATTLYPHVVRLADGRQIKLVVEAYYGSGQEGCNERGAAGSDSANITMRWSWL